MSTRAVIGVYTNRCEGQFRAVYHHFDGYPSGLGQALWGIYKKFYQGHLSAMMEYIVDAHPEGWSSLVGSDFGKQPTWLEPDDRKALTDAKVPYDEWPPIAYKYRRGEMVDPLDETSDRGQEWGYVFDLKANTMTILKVVSAVLTYAEVATIPLDGIEPDWLSFE